MIEQFRWEDSGNGSVVFVGKTTYHVQEDPDEIERMINKSVTAALAVVLKRMEKL
jgi:hypothetical protein